VNAGFTRTRQRDTLRFLFTDLRKRVYFTDRHTLSPPVTVLGVELGQRIKEFRRFGITILLVTSLPSLTTVTIAQRARMRAAWHELSPPDAPFSVLLPGVPEQSADDPGSGLVRHFYQLKVGPCEYDVTWISNVPDNMLEPESIRFLFARAPKNLIKAAEQAGKMGLSLTHEKELMLEGYRGQEFTLESPSEEVEGRGFIIDHDWVTFAACHPKEKSASADALRFFKSISLGETVQVNSLPPANAPASNRNAEVDRRPVPLNRPKPSYTEDARDHRFEGIERLRVRVSPGGTAEQVVPINELPYGLNEEAIKSASQLRFRPALKHHKPVAYWVIVEVEFALSPLAVPQR